MILSDQVRQVVTVSSNFGERVDAEVTVDPAADAILLAGAALYAGYWDFFLHASWTVDAGLRGVSIQHRNAANSATIWSILVYMTGVGYYNADLLNYQLTVNERIRFQNAQAFTGRISCSLHGRRRMST